MLRGLFSPYDPECFYSENPTILDKYFIETILRNKQNQRQAVEWITDPDLIIKLYVWINDKTILC